MIQILDNFQEETFMKILTPATFSSFKLYDYAAARR
jgi:hypothetical protein